MGTASLVQGRCDISKNGFPFSSLYSSLCYDQDLGFFKVIGPGGNIQASFVASQIAGVSSFQTGVITKAVWLTITYKLPNGDEFALKYRAPSAGAAENAIKWLNYASRKDGATEDVITLMKTREKVPFAEVSAVLAKRSLPSNEAEVKRMLEYGISNRKIEGIIDGSQFVSRSALQREQVRYEIVTNVDFSSSGAVSFKCRSCGKSLPLDKKQESGKCEYCGTAYTLPKKLLDLI